MELVGGVLVGGVLVGGVLVGGVLVGGVLVDVVVDDEVLGTVSPISMATTVRRNRARHSAALVIEAR